MAIPLKYNTASQEFTFGQALDTTDGDTEEPSLTIANTDIKLHKAGATTLANKNSGGATYISNGVYYGTFDTTDTNTYGPMTMYIHVAGALSMKVEFLVMNAVAYDALYGTDNFDVNTVSWNSVSLGTTNPLPNAAADAAGGLPISDAGGLDMDALSTVTVAQIATELTDALRNDALAEVAAVPAANASIADKINWMFALSRNKGTQTSTTKTLLADDGSTPVSSATISSDGTTFTRNEYT